MPTSLLTGGTGFVGAHVARALVSRGWRVRLLARGGPERLRRAVPEGEGIEVVAGDLSAGTDLARAAKGVDAIVHVAGITRARSLEEYREINARGTQRLVEAARRSAPGARFILVSSQAAGGPARDGRPVREEDPARPVSWYGRSKAEGEEAVRRGWPGPWIVVRPSVVYGPGDRGLFVLFRSAARGVLPVPQTGTSIQVIRAERAAGAIADAAGRPDLAGRTGFLCDPEPVSIRDLSEAIAALAPRRPILLPIPRAVIRLAGGAQTVLESLTRRSRPFNADKAREMLAGDWVSDSGPFLRDLGLPEPPPLAEGLKDTWEWYRRSGWLIL